MLSDPQFWCLFVAAASLLGGCNGYLAGHGIGRQRLNRSSSRLKDAEARQEDADGGGALTDVRDRFRDLASSLDGWSRLVHSTAIAGAVGAVVLFSSAVPLAEYDLGLFVLALWTGGSMAVAPIVVGGLVYGYFLFKLRALDTDIDDLQREDKPATLLDRFQRDLQDGG